MLKSLLTFCAAIAALPAFAQVDLDGDGNMETIQPSPNGGTDIVMLNSESIPFVAFHASGKITPTGKRTSQGFEDLEADGRIWTFAQLAYFPVIRPFEIIGEVDEAIMRKINVFMGNDAEFGLMAIASNQRVRLMDGYEAVLLWSSAYTMSDGQMIYAVILKDGEPISAPLISVDAHGWYPDGLPNYGTSPDLSRIEYVNSYHSQLEAYDVKTGERLPDPYMRQAFIIDAE